MSGPVQVRNKLDVIPRGVIRELLQFRRRERVGFDHGSGALILEVAFELDGEPVDLVKGRPAKSRFQHVQMLQVVSVVPIDDSESKVRPVGDFSFRQPQTSAFRPQQLNEGLDTIEKPRRGVRLDADAAGGESDLVRLLGKRAPIAVGGFSDLDRVRRDGETYGLRAAAWGSGLGHRDAKSRLQVFSQSLDSHVIGPDALTQPQPPSFAELEVAAARLELLDLGKSGMPPRVKW